MQIQQLQFKTAFIVKNKNNIYLKKAFDLLRLYPLPYKWSFVDIDHNDTENGYIFMFEIKDLPSKDECRQIEQILRKIMNDSLK